MNEGEDYGPNWIRRAFRVTVNSLGEDVARLLNDLYAGIYHIQPECSRVDWANEHHIEVVIHGPWSTFDFDNLTRLVFLAHDYALRVQMDARAPGYTRLMFHRRQREGELYKRHPSIENALSDWRKFHNEHTLS